MWQLKQLERLYEVEPEAVDTVVNELLGQESVLWEKLVIGAYLDEDINLSKAAEFLHIHPVEIRKRFLAKGIPIRIGVESIEDIRAEAAAARGMRGNER